MILSGHLTRTNLGLQDLALMELLATSLALLFPRSFCDVLHMYYVDLNEYFMLIVQSGLRLCGTLLTSGMGAGATFDPIIVSLLNGLPQQHFETH